MKGTTKVTKYYDETTGKYGFKDKNTGKIVVEAKYDVIGISRFGLFPVRIEREWGFVDSNGKESVECKYDRIRPFGRFYPGWLVKKDGKFGVVDTTGKKIFECKYDMVVSGSEKGFTVIIDDKWGYVDRTGKEVVECEYDGPSEVEEKLKEYKQKRQMITEYTAEQPEIIENIKAEYTKKINEAYDRDASEEEIEQILEDCKDALGKVIIEEAKKEKNREKALEKLHGILYGATAKTEGVSND